MYIYNINKNKNTVTTFRVDQQLCGKCLLAHAENKLNNDFLDSDTKKLVLEHRKTICENVKPDKSIFLTKSKNSFIIFNNNQIPDLSQESVNRFRRKNKSYLNIPETLKMYPSQYMNPYFHVHENINQISLQLDENDAIVVNT